MVAISRKGYEVGDNNTISRPDIQRVGSHDEGGGGGSDNSRGGG